MVRHWLVHASEVEVMNWKKKAIVHLEVHVCQGQWPKHPRRRCSDKGGR